MFFHHSDLAYKVRVDNPNPMYARMLQQAIGGPEGEMRVMNQYLFQGFNARGPVRYRDMLLSTGTEEIGHIEVLATAVCMNLEGAKSELVDQVATNPMIAARMGGIEPRHFLSTGGGATPADANGVPFNAACIDAGGNLRADMRANVAAEAIGRTLATRLYEATDDPGMKDMWRFLIARDTMHQQQWLAVLEELEDPANAPGDFENEGDFAHVAYGFFNHTDAIPPADAAWTPVRRSTARASSMSSTRTRTPRLARSCRMRRTTCTAVRRPRSPARPATAAATGARLRDARPDARDA